MTIRRIRRADNDLLEATCRLTHQLGAPAGMLDLAALSSTLDDPRLHLLVAQSDDGKIGGMLTFVWYESPSGRKGWIEDLVVEESERGKGLGERLMREAIERARRTGCQTLNLTSNPSRLPAHRLYRRCGFDKRETTVYRLELGRTSTDSV